MENYKLKKNIKKFQAIYKNEKKKKTIITFSRLIRFF